MIIMNYYVMMIHYIELHGITWIHLVVGKFYQNSPLCRFMISDKEWPAHTNVNCQIVHTN